MNYEIIDAHAHIFPEKIAENATASTGHFYDLPMDSIGVSQKLIEAGETIGVSRYLVCSAATVPHQVHSINNFIHRECEQNSCFFGFGTTHPLSEDIYADIEQVKSLGLHGIKLHPDFQEFDADSSEAFKIYEIMEGQLPLLIHCGDSRYNWSSPDKIRRICENFPNLQIQAAHLGGYQRWDEAEELLTGFKNVRVDISSSLPFMSKNDAVRRIKKFGVENCFFGCDFPMWNHKSELDLFLTLGFSKEENSLILAENFKNFYKI